MALYLPVSGKIQPSSRRQSKQRPLSEIRNKDLGNPQHAGSRGESVDWRISATSSFHIRLEFILLAQFRPGGRSLNFLPVPSEDTT
jgi:hypothetical protein